MKVAIRRLILTHQPTAATDHKFERATGCFITQPAMPSYRTPWLTCSLPFPIRLQPTSGRTY